MNLERRKFFIDLKKKNKALVLNLDYIFFQTLEENLNIDIPNCNKAEGVKLFSQNVMGYNFFHSSVYHHVIGDIYLYK